MDMKQISFVCGQSKVLQLRYQGSGDSLILILFEQAKEPIFPSLQMSAFPLK
jgi:hypothetical protein